MALNVNTVSLVGNLTADPEYKEVPKGDVTLKFCDFRIAVNHGKDASGEDRPASFFTVTARGGNAVACKNYLSKGRPVAVSGELRQERWADKETGGNRERVKISANVVQFLGAPPQANAEVEAPSEPAATDDIPF